ncbi:MAG: hypothetical protein AAF296_10950 [Pseudomonadota bacterium]
MELEEAAQKWAAFFGVRDISQSTFVSFNPSIMIDKSAVADVEKSVSV